MSAHGDVPVEEIARLTGHSDSRTIETVYRHELRPVIRSGAGVMDRLLGQKTDHIVDARRDRWSRGAVAVAWARRPTSAHCTEPFDAN
jgi:hypothetical protein